MNIIIIGNTNNFDIAYSLVKNNDVNIIAGIVDTFNEKTAKAQREFLENNKIKEINFEEVKNYNPDLCLILTYNTIIPTEYFKNTLLLNIHGGILPKWRGSSTNAWAIINGEKEVGYSLHKADDTLDAGDIYYICKANIKPNQKYGEVIPELRSKMIKKLPQILSDISKNKIKPISQKGKKFLYTTRLRKSDGIITDWNKTSEYIYNLFRVMASPYGSGVFFKYKEDLYEIKDMCLADFCPDYIGIPGAIVYVGDNYMQIKTLNNIIIVKEISLNGKNISIKNTFKQGIRL